jgi:O-antigen biosynthesis protein WbqV
VLDAGATLTRAALKKVGDVGSAILCGFVDDRAAARKLLEQIAALRLRPLIADLSDTGVIIRPMAMADVLGRAPSPVDWENIRGAFEGKRVLVTGAGGSIGSELVRQLVALNPARLTLLDSSEFNLFSIDHELAQIAPDVVRVPALCCIRNQDALTRWFARERPEIVFHVAALKQVPLLESHAGECVLTNIMGTRNVARASRAAGAHMVLVSTDKAVSPRSTMGASKRMAEAYCQALDVQCGARGGSHFLVARLGNVLGSTGSVSPLFERQLKRGGPLTVTHPDVVRYFITIPQAAAFLLQACATALGAGEAAPRGVAHVLDMGEPVRVIDLASDMIRLAGLQPEEDVKIRFVGLRPGEKLAEQLVDDNEWVVGDHSGPVMAVASEPRDIDAVDRDMDALIGLANAGRDEMVKARLMALVGVTSEERDLAVG